MPEIDCQGTILVVDDEIKNSKLVEALLAPRGYLILKAFNGEEAIEKAKKHRPDLILLDVTMPVMNGFEACKMLKDNPATRFIPVVFMTALGQVQDRVKGLEAGGDDFLTKPVDRDELIARVRSSIRHKKAMDQRINFLEKAQDHLAKFVPDSLQRLIAQNPISPDLKKKKQDVSVLFVDITGYTKLTEALTQEHVNFIVESLFSSFIDSIKANDGEISATAGDGMMVMFLEEDPIQNARNAVQTALELLQITKRLDEQPNALSVFEGSYEPIRVHIGVNSGEAFVGPAKFEGSIGTHWSYTAVGSPINVAARIAALAKGDTALVGEETARRIQHSFSLNEIGLREIKNGSHPIMLFELTGRTTNADETHSSTAAKIASGTTLVASQSASRAPLETKDPLRLPSHPPPISDHQLLRRIGGGAYGEVWLAMNLVGVHHAVKIVYRNRFESVAPYEREFKGIQTFMPVSFSEPGFLRILHVGRNEPGGYFFYIMEAADDETSGRQIDPTRYVPRSLGSEIERRGPLPAAECLSLMLQLTKALDGLHERKLIHRDIKPSNIIYVGGVPKLADIGLVKQIALTKGPATTTVVGTQGFLLPEEAGTTRADLYALGKVLYMALSGLAAGQFPEWPSHLAERSDGAMRSELNEIVWKACDMSRRSRYSTAREIYADLCGIQAGVAAVNAQPGDS